MITLLDNFRVICAYSLFSKSDMRTLDSSNMRLDGLANFSNVNRALHRILLTQRTFYSLDS
jgi:hypothetical protein